MAYRVPGGSVCLIALSWSWPKWEERANVAPVSFHLRLASHGAHTSTKHLNEDWSTSTRRLSISRTRLIFYQCEYKIKALQVEVGTAANRTNNTFSLSDLFTLAAGKHHEATWAPLAGTARLFPP